MTDLYHHREFVARFIRFEDDGSGPYAVNNFRKQIAEKISALLLQLREVKIEFSGPNRKPAHTEITWDSENLHVELDGMVYDRFHISVSTKNREGVMQLDEVARRLLGSLESDYDIVDQYNKPFPYPPAP